MIVLLDVKEQNILLYKEDGLIKIPFNEASNIVEHMGENNKITYITNAIKVNSVDIINLIKNLGIKVNELNDVETSKNKYLCGTVDGMTYIDENLKFQGKYDCKLIDDNMRNTIKQNPLLQTLIKNNKIKIIGEIGRSKLLKELKILQKKEFEEQEKKAKKMDKLLQKTKNKGSIIVGDMDDDEDNDGDVIVIDLKKEGEGKRISIGGGASVNTMSELMEQIEGSE